MEVHSGSQRNDVRDVRGSCQRKACPVKKVNSSRSKNQTVILSETELDTEALMNAIRSTGYEVGTIQKEPYKKRGLFG